MLFYASVITNIPVLTEKGERMKEVKSAIEILTGNYPEEVEENCGTTWFKTDGKWYYIMIEECVEGYHNEV